MSSISFDRTKYYQILLHFSTTTVKVVQKWVGVSRVQSFILILVGSGWVILLVSLLGSGQDNWTYVQFWLQRSDTAFEMPRNRQIFWSVSGLWCRPYVVVQSYAPIASSMERLYALHTAGVLYIKAALETWTCIHTCDHTARRTREDGLRSGQMLFSNSVGQTLSDRTVVRQLYQSTNHWSKAFAIRDGRNKNAYCLRHYGHWKYGDAGIPHYFTMLWQNKHMQRTNGFSFIWWIYNFTFFICSLNYTTDFRNHSNLATTMLLQEDRHKLGSF